MFPFGNNGEISFQVTKNEQDLILENHLLGSVNLSSTSSSSRGGRGRKSLADNRAGGVASASASRPPNDTEPIDPETMKKKMVHRDIERQRRHEMSSLFSTLRSLLPSQYSKGKRSMSDHIVESVKYIKDMQKNIKELGDRRDGLQASDNNNIPNSMNELTSNIQIYTNAIGLQVQIVVCQTQQGFSVSTALKILHEYGFDVVSTVSNAANGAFHHNIQCQGNEATYDNTNLQWLQQRLYDAFG